MDKVGERMQYKLLVVDDEPDVLRLLKDYFELNDYQIDTASNGQEALIQLEKNPDLILLDVNMPEMDGITLCRMIRETVSCPILFLTAKIEEADKITGFAAGGDDYILKPFSIDELGARVAAHLRREERLTTDKNIRHFGQVMIDYTAKVVTFHNQSIPFAKKEFEIIELLSKNIGQVFDKEHIYTSLWGVDATGDSTVVAEHIRRIRRKLVAVGEEYHIETIWGMGYKWIK